VLKPYFSISLIFFSYYVSDMCPFSMPITTPKHSSSHGCSIWNSLLYVLPYTFTMLPMILHDSSHTVSSLLFCKWDIIILPAKGLKFPPPNTLSQSPSIIYILGHYIIFKDAQHSHLLVLLHCWVLVFEFNTLTLTILLLLYADLPLFLRKMSSPPILLYHSYIRIDSGYVPFN